jgi:CCR4-NOT transcription complex subunit 1
LAVKDLLLTAHAEGRLAVVVPFVCKVLDQCPRSLVRTRSSPLPRRTTGAHAYATTADAPRALVATVQVFRPPNPWTMALLRLLAELYATADLRLNLKFEIEVLFKALRLEVKDVPPSSLLAHRAAATAAALPPASTVAGPSGASVGTAAGGAGARAAAGASAPGLDSKLDVGVGGLYPGVALGSTAPQVRTGPRIYLLWFLNPAGG